MGLQRVTEAPLGPVSWAVLVSEALNGDFW